MTARYENLIDGHDCPPAQGAYLDSENPWTTQVWAQIPRSTPEDIDRAVAAASAAFRNAAWAGISATKRAALMRRLGDLVEANAKELALAEVRDNGKTYTEMLRQMLNTAEWYRYYGGLCDKIEGRVIPVEAPGHFNYTLREPLGVIAMIIPWNSPVRLLAWKLAPALAAGNTCVIKPSEHASTSTLTFARLVREAGFPDGVVNVVCGLGAEIGPALTDHPDIAKVAFTGGVGSGTAVYVAAAKRMRPATLELGGKSPNIVFADADLDAAVQGVAGGIFASGGQSCVAGSRLLVADAIHDAFVARLADVARRIRMGDPMDAATHVGPVANRPQFEHIMKMISMARDEGATIACGGESVTGAQGGLFVQPTICTGVTADMRIAQEEVFGPVLSVLRFSTEEEAVALANSTRFGLGAGIWTTDVGRAHRMAARVRSGSVWVNTYRMTSQTSPFGGFDLSGVGREGGQAMIDAYLQTKSVWVNTTGVMAPAFPSL
ncbi:aldehyde dehydrogenase [Xylophilus sp. GOD-11R]|uniref:aldehyde dehydrogenase n=1 Tax=Xylophilus sp. GOD-11R TaxID=3089814 RepID=UPI00298CE809|nr:aldehyde dehydrogenase [Xylophilus sp. GOD-11R]WPB56443.1 aldehyde dehydrogenase [Xylophilus sp. GOD-11R]